MTKILKLLFLVLVGTLVFKVQTVNSSYFYAPSSVMSYNEYWDLRVEGSSPTEAEPWLQKRIQADYQAYRSSAAADEQQRLGLIHSGTIPKLTRAAIVIQNALNVGFTGLGEFVQNAAPSIYIKDTFLAGITAVLLCLGIIILSCVFFTTTDFRNQRIYGMSALSNPIGWYRLTVIIFAFLLLGWINQITGHFFPLHWGFSMLYSAFLCWLIYHYFLQD